MEFVQDLIVAFRDPPGAVAVCIGFPVVLALFIRGDGPSVTDQSDCNSDGAGGCGD
jgi:hypothetical protein